MGAWGYGPEENDTAADFCSDIDKIPLPEIIQKGLNSDEPEEIRISAWLLSQVGINYVYPIELYTKHHELAIKKLAEILDDDDEEYRWIDEWNDPIKVRKLITAEKQELENRIELQVG